jgi:hypothetical protein
MPSTDVLYSHKIALAGCIFSLIHLYRDKSDFAHSVIDPFINIKLILLEEYISK